MEANIKLRRYNTQVAVNIVLSRISFEHKRYSSGCGSLSRCAPGSITYFFDSTHFWSRFDHLEDYNMKVLFTLYTTISLASLVLAAPTKGGKKSKAARKRDLAIPTGWYQDPGSEFAKLFEKKEAGK